MKVIFSVLFLIFLSMSGAVANEYSAEYCHDQAELQKWERLMANNPDSEPLAAIHALWIGLCVKVEARQLTTTQANRLFEWFRNALIDQIQQQETSPDGEGI